MDIPPLAKNPIIPPDGTGEEPRKSLGNLRKQLETGQGLPPLIDKEAVIENKNQALANPRIQTPNIGNTGPKPQ